jgi:hypothetical protein
MTAVSRLNTALASCNRGGSPLVALLLRALMGATVLCVPAVILAEDAADPNAPTFDDSPTRAMNEVESMEAEPPADGPVVSQSSYERPYREAIGQLETERGAYADGLSEQLLSLGLTLQRQGRHGEALDLFKRGAHLARINYGLYSAEQLPLLQAEIASHMATGKLAKADERQQYMYRVQMRTLDSGASRAAALMQQAGWQFSAYRLEVGGPGFMRLMNMWDLYRLAVNDIVNREGQSSEGLLPPLYGMLRAQYLISEYSSEQDTGFEPGDSYSGTLEYNRFNAYRHQSYDKGRAVIQAIYELQHEGENPDPVAAAGALVMLGDWHLWHEQRDEANQAYRDAIAELAELADAQVHIERLLGQPEALPALKGVRPLPATVAPDEGNILLEFSVNERGRVLDLERLDENEVNEGRTNRLMRRLRKTPFRPRFEQGEPVATEGMLWAYVIEN